MSTRAHFCLRTVIIGSALVGAFVLGAVFGHLKPWQKKLSASEEAEISRIAGRMALPAVLNKCKMSSIEATSNQDDRDTYVMACMENKGYTPAMKEHGCNYLRDTYSPETSECWVPR